MTVGCTVILPLLLLLLGMAPAVTSTSLFVTEGHCKGGRLCCPSSQEVIEVCDEATIFYHHKCCGKGNMYCCLRMDNWVLVSFGLVSLFISVLIVIAFYRLSNEKGIKDLSYEKPPHVHGTASERTSVNDVTAIIRKSPRTSTPTICSILLQKSYSNPQKTLTSPHSIAFVLLLFASVAVALLPPLDPMAVDRRGGSDVRSAIPGIATLGVGDVTKTVSRFIPIGAGGDNLADTAYNRDDRPGLGYMDRETAAGQSHSSKSIFVLPGVGRFETAEAKEQGTVFPFLQLPPLKEGENSDENESQQQRTIQPLFDLDEVKHQQFGQVRRGRDDSTPAPRSAFNPASLFEGVLPDALLRETPAAPLQIPIDVDEASRKPSARAQSKQGEMTADEVHAILSRLRRNFGAVRRKQPIDEDEDLLGEAVSFRGLDQTLPAKPIRHFSTQEKINRFKAALGTPIATLGLAKEQIAALCAKFAPIAAQHCSKSTVDPAFAQRCHEYALDCAEFQAAARPLSAVANSFSSGVGLTLGSFGINGIPYYPINEEGGVGGGSHGKIDFGSWGGGYSSNTGVRDYFSQTGEFGANWYEGTYGGKNGWSIPIAQSLGAEGGGGTMVSVPVKEGELGRPIEASSGYFVGPYFGTANKATVDWYKGGVAFNRGFSVPVVGVSVSQGIGAGFPSIGSIMNAYNAMNPYHLAAQTLGDAEAMGIAG